MQEHSNKNESLLAMTSRASKRRRLFLAAVKEKLESSAKANDELKRLLTEIRPHFFDNHAIAKKIDSALRQAKQ
jgi:hypothetical protein